MKNSRRLLTAGAAAALVASCALSANAYSFAPLLDRSANGRLSEPGGAARLDGDQTSTIRASIQKPGAKNVILIIGDGMGASEITIARNYLVGAGQALGGIDALPLSGFMTHYSLRKDGKPDYTPDSAATGTAWATGVKTYDNAISVDINEKPHQTLLEYAKKTGRATGDITTSEIQDATPAVQVAKVSLRKCYGPEATSKDCPAFAKEKGGLGSISEQLLDTRPDVTLGGGSKTFSEKAKAGRWAGKTLEQQARERGYNYITEKDQLAGVRAANQNKPVLGLFDEGNLPVKFNELVATKGGAEEGKAAQRCTVNDKWRKVPALGDMTRKSIDLLSNNDKGKKNGFFLQVESASIDKKDHAADACGQIGETDQINDAVKAALSFAKKDGNTLVIVTADHAHTSQIVDGPTPGLDTKLLTNEGSEMVVTYGTSPAGGSQQHTGAEVPVAAYGPGAANVVGLIDQTDLNAIIKNGFNSYKKGGHRR
ncbi:alkaline phosphatase [Nigerium massiliense]|uniref:alkaline phosphatase n=1 Tax=Nigerium massiliense TaxID=1522317 RepID=UPI000693FC7C|nr:alkaline phosphatase [Nigerium massiliense]